MLSRAARVPQRLPPCPTSLNHYFMRRLASTEAADATTKPKSPPIRTAYIRSWRPPQNITETWIMIREIEKRYGKILETHFLKDFEDAGKYQMMTYVVFNDPKSLERIPDSGTDVTVSSRPVDKPNHEIGLEDMERLVPSGPLTSTTPAEFEDAPAADPQNDSSVLGFRIYRAKMDYRPESIPRRWFFQKASHGVVKQFQAWGGFADLTPLDKPRLMKEQELFAGPGVNDQIRMRASLDLCERHFSRYPNAAATPSPVSSIKSGPAYNKTLQEPPQEPSTPPKSAPILNASTSAPAPASAVQDPASTLPSQEAKSKPTTASKSEPPKSASQPTQATTSEAAEPTANKPPAAKATTEKAPSRSKPSPLPSKGVVAPKASKPTGQKLPPPVQQQQPTASIPRKQPKPRIQASRSAPIRSAPTQSKTTAEVINEEPAPAEAPGTLTKLWGMLTGRRR